MLSDIEIAQKSKLKKVKEIAKKAKIDEEFLELYGDYKAKVNLKIWDKIKDNKKGKLVYTTAITPTPAGEGKTCTAVGTAQALGKLEKDVFLCLREPSLGPTFGIKGGAAGGGYSQVLPMEDINLHFTGDIHAVGAAHNLLAAMVDNHIVKGNELGIDPTKRVWKRVMDISDRQLRNIVVGLGGKANGVPMESAFDITVASEVMAILCMANDMTDLKERLGKLIVAYTYDGKPVYAQDVKATGAMAVLLKDAIKPNLVQTIEGQPAFVHGGPFANIAHGNNTVVATRMALRLSDYVVTEGGFAADLGAEKFFDIVCRYTDLKPDVAVLVATARALNMHGGVSKEKVSETNLEALEKGCANLDKHIENLKKYGLPVVVAINRFPTDSQEELDLIKEHCDKLGVRSAISEVVARGGEGGLELGEAILDALENDKSEFKMLYESSTSIKEKIEAIATELYGADGVVYTKAAEKDIKIMESNGLGQLPVCMAKTQSSLSDDPALKGAPRGWTLTVREVRASAGAGFLVPLTGTMLTMPGLPKVPASEKVDILEDGTILGLF